MDRFLFSGCGLLKSTGGALAVAAALAGFSEANAVDHFTQTRVVNGFYPQQVMTQYDGSDASSTLSTDGFVTFASTQYTAIWNAAASASMDRGELKVKADVLVDATAPARPAGQVFLMSAGEAAFADQITIAASSLAAYDPSAVATITMTVDGYFTVPDGIDLTSGGVNPYSFFDMVALIGVYDAGTIELQRQLDELNPADYPNINDYLNAYDDLQQQIVSQTHQERVSIAHSNQANVDLYNTFPGVTAVLATNGLVQLVLTAEIPLADLTNTFEFVNRMRTRVSLDSNERNLKLESDFYSTSLTTIVIPEGYTFSSTSGRLGNLVQIPGGPSDPVATPEPATAALSLLTAGGLMLAARRRRIA